MNAGIVAEAAGLFAVTNVDDILVLSLFFGRSAGQDGAARVSAPRVSFAVTDGALSCWSKVIASSTVTWLTGPTATRIGAP